jgi:hypothetical protein
VLAGNLGCYGQLSRSTQFEWLPLDVIDGLLYRPAARPVPSEDAILLASVNDKPSVGADAPSLTAAARAGARIDAAGAREWLPLGRTRELDLKRLRPTASGDGATSQFRFPHVVGYTGSGNAEVEVHQRSTGGHQLSLAPDGRQILFCSVFPRA